MSKPCDTTMPDIAPMAESARAAPASAAGAPMAQSTTARAAAEPPPPKRQRSSASSSGGSGSTATCVRRGDAQGFCAVVLSGASSQEGAVRVDDACIPAIQHACGELCMLLVHVARRCILAESAAAEQTRLTAAEQTRLTVKQLVAAMHELRRCGMLVDSAIPGAVELRSDFGDSRGCDPRVCVGGPVPPTGLPPTGQSLAGQQQQQQQQVLVSEHLLQAEPVSGSSSAMELLMQEPESHGAHGNGAPDPAVAAATAAAAAVRGSSSPVTLNEYL
jgi:hypothetical protein